MAMRDDAWFAGFTDGEGSFQIRNDGGPRFVLALRVDDYSVLEQLRLEFGGTRVCIKQHDRRNYNTNPSACWTVVSKHDLQKLVDYFDQFPLRAKKARDYAIWRSAVTIYREKGRKAPELLALAAALRRVRECPEDAMEQVRLKLVS